MTNSQKLGDNTLDFILAGNATFTVLNTETDNRFTFKVARPSDNTPHFVSVLAGPNNENDFVFLGTIFDKRTYRHGKKSPVNFHAQSAKVFTWFWRHISSDSLPSQVEVYHEGYCGRCGRLLTVPESITSGIGPVCKEKMQ